MHSERGTVTLKGWGQGLMTAYEGNYYLLSVCFSTSKVHCSTKESHAVLTSLIINIASKYIVLKMPDQLNSANNNDQSEQLSSTDQNEQPGPSNPIDNRPSERIDSNSDRASSELSERRRRWELERRLEQDHERKKRRMIEEYERQRMARSSSSRSSRRSRECRSRSPTRSRRSRSSSRSSRSTQYTNPVVFELADGTRLRQSELRSIHIDLRRNNIPQPMDIPPEQIIRSIENLESITIPRRDDEGIVL